MEIRGTMPAKLSEGVEVMTEDVSSVLSDQYLFGPTY